MPGFVVANLLRPVLFVLAIVAAVIAGDTSGSFWIGLLAFFVAMGCGRVLRRLIRGRPLDAVYAALWPAFAVLFAWLFAGPLDLAKWLAAILAFICAGIAKLAFANSFLPRRSRLAGIVQVREWGIPWLDDVIPGTWSARDD
ncbi:MAG TPA: hypothetical protein VHD91_00860 [Gaiellaceae bacterium]|nr:hypothetical protein [Gaiellaceae bacterium]